MSEDRKQRIGRALGRVPQSLYVMTAQFEERATGVMVSWVQQAGFDPPMIVAALGKGRPIIPLLHDSHSFAICQIARSDKLTMRRFAKGAEEWDNPFDAIDVFRGETGSPIIRSSLAYLDCALVRHLDVEGDHDLYVGLVRDGDLMLDEEPIIHLRDSGLHY
jgi:flavin reductase (DIM6/NTAB) family NADH-FMN oxidoreductase RutF